MYENSIKIKPSRIFDNNICTCFYYCRLCVNFWLCVIQCTQLYLHRKFPKEGPFELLSMYNALFSCEFYTILKHFKHNIMYIYIMMSPLLICK